MVCSRYPRECRYYETVLKRKCFRKLKNNVWETKVKWQLLEKADFHYRAKILSKCLNSWIIFTNESLLDRLNRNLADSFYEERLKIKGLSAFKRNVELNRIVIEKLYEKTENKLKAQAWHKWKHYTLKRLKIKEVKYLADKIREEKLVIGFLHAWFFWVKRKFYLRDAEERGMISRNRKLKKKYFNFWKIYNKERHYRKQINWLSNTFYKERLKDKIFWALKSHVRKKKILKNKAKKFDIFYKNNLIEDYLKKWIEVHEKACKRKEIQKYNLAINFYNTKILLKKYFKRLFEFMKNVKSMKEKMEEFQIRRAEIYVSFYVNLWGKMLKEKLHLNALESKAVEWRQINLIDSYLKKLYEKYIEGIEESERISEVIKYSEVMVLHRTFKNWKEFTSLKIIKKNLVENSLELYRDSLKRKIFQKLKEFVILKRRKKFAMAHRENRLTLKVFKRWKVAVDEKKKILSKVVRLNEKLNFQLLNFAFDVWKIEVRSANGSTQAAIKFYTRSKLSKAFAAWRKYTHRRKFKKLQYQGNSSILQKIFIRNYLFLWWDISLRKQELNVKLEEVKRKQAKSSKRLFFSAWYDFVQKLKRIRQTEEHFPDFKSTILSEQYTIKLLESLRLRKALKEKEELAKKMEENNLKRKYLNKWIYFLELKRETILESVYEQKKSETLRNKVKIVSGVQDKYSRRKPIIPHYLKSKFRLNETDFAEESFSSAKKDLTFKVTEPINKRLPMVGQKEMFVSFAASR